MTLPLAIGLVVGLAVLAANWPFVTRRWFLVLPLKSNKGAALELLELLLLYLLVGVFGVSLERYLGQVSAQGWEFYAITFCLFLTLAFPGFVVRHLVKRRGGDAP